MISKNLWLDIQTEWNNKNVLKINLNCKDIILGYNIHFGITSIASKSINMVILYGKSFIMKCKSSNSPVNIVRFKKYLKEWLEICQYEEDVNRMISTTLF